LGEWLRGLWEVFTFAYDVKGFPFPYLHFPESQQTFAIMLNLSLIRVVDLCMHALVKVFRCVCFTKSKKV